MSLIVWMLIAVGAGLVLGAGLLAIGLRGRRVNDHPICRRCGFDLVGRQDLRDTWGESVCTECGADLKRRRAIRWGFRRRRPAVAGIGAVLLAAAVVGGGAIGWGAATSFDWNRVTPVWLLARELGSADPAAVAAAADELVDRIDDGRLSADGPRGPQQAERVARAVLEMQGDLGRAWHVEAGQVFERLWQGDLLTPELVKRYIAQSMPVTIRTRDAIAPGDPLPVQFEVERRGGADGMVVMYGSMLDLVVDGKLIGGQQHSFQVMLRSTTMTWQTPTTVRFSTMHRAVNYVGAERWTPQGLDLPPGRYDVTMRVLVHRKPKTDERWWGVLESRRSGATPEPIPQDLTSEELVRRYLPTRLAEEPAELTHSEIIEFEAPLIVTEAPQVELVTGEAAARVTGRFATLVEIDRRQTLQLTVWPATALPEDMGLACEVLVAVEDGQEELIGGFCYDPAAPLWGGSALVLAMPDAAPGERVRVTLRPSPAWARRTVGLTRILGEEIEVELVAPE